MPTTTTVPAFEAALVSALQARPGLSGVQVLGYFPGPDTEGEGIYLGDWSSDEGPSIEIAPSAVKTGRQRRVERADIPFTIQDWRSAEAIADLPVAKARVFALFAEVDSALADDPAMNNTVDWNVRIVFRTRQVPAGRGWAIRGAGAITIHSRLT